MVTEILNKMAEIVAKTMTCFQSDFEKYDKEYIVREGVNAFPFLWMVHKSHTYLIRLSKIKRDFFEQEGFRYDIMQNCSWIHAYLWPTGMKVTEDIYYVTEDDVIKVNLEQARNIARAAIDITIAAWEQEHGKLPTKFKVPVEIGGISLNKLKEFILDCRSHNDDSLLKCMKRFHNYRQQAKDHKVSIWYDERYNEFSFAVMVNGECQMNGGIIFHGWPESGYQQSNSVQLSPQYGWASHT